MKNKKSKNLGAISAFISLIAFIYYCVVTYFVYDSYNIALGYFDENAVFPQSFSIQYGLKLIFILAGALGILLGIIGMKSSKIFSRIGIIVSIILVTLVFTNPIIYFL